jgi:hypothetical protein
VHWRSKDRLICTLISYFVVSLYTNNAYPMQMHTKTNYSAWAPAQSNVVKTLDHGAVAVHPDRPSVVVFLVQLHPNTAQEHRAPVPAIIQGGIGELVRVPSKNGNGGKKKM